MTTPSLRFRSLCALVLAVGAYPVSAQDAPAPSLIRRVAIDTVTGYQDFFREVRDWPAQGVFDVYAAIEPRAHWQISFRPKLWRVQGDWDVMVDQASVRREFQGRTSWRIEAGKFPSMIGYGVMENRPTLNAGILWWHRPYYMPLPALGPAVPMLSLVSTTYPWGVQVGTSATHWDARGAIVDRAPVEFWRGDPRASRSPHAVVGGGVTPVAGLRVGAGTAWGQLVKGDAGSDSSYRMLNIEGEFAFGHTKISGEWTTDSFVVGGRDAMARGWTVQAQHTFSPQVFAHTRLTAVRASASLGSPTERQFGSIDTTIGYRLDSEITLRVAHSAVESFSGTQIDHQVGVSLMWARRWW